jgi:hypothetical protein
MSPRHATAIGKEFLMTKRRAVFGWVAMAKK